jgi:hypothetical protein
VSIVNEEWVCNICGRTAPVNEANSHATPEGWGRFNPESVLVSGKVKSDRSENTIKFGLQLSVQVKRVLVRDQILGDQTDVCYCNECRGGLLRSLKIFMENLLKVSAVRNGGTWEQVDKAGFVSGGF